MNKHPAGSVGRTHPLPGVQDATASITKTLKQTMKTRLELIKRLVVLGGAMTAVAAYGQTTYTWTGGNGTGIYIGYATNWGGTLPSTASNDTGQWDGSVPGALALLYDNASLQSGPGQSGINIYMTSSQTSPLSIDSTKALPAYLAITHITIDSGAGAFTLGGNTANRLDVIGRPNGAVHNYVNNSANVATIQPKVRWAGGGGAAWTFAFSGTGDWVANNYLVNDNGPGMFVQVDGPGTLYWRPVSSGFVANGLDGVTINGGKLVLAGNHPKLNTRSMVNNAVFEFNAPTNQTLGGAISGSGTLVVSNGALTLGGANTFSGNITLGGGSLILNSAENVGVSGPLGIGGLVTFAGGTLQFSVNNTFDYSSRFDTAAGQNYKLDSGGQTVTLATDLASSGATLGKSGSGTIILSGASSYSGLTTVSAGKLVFQGVKSGSGSITVANSAALGVTVTGTQVTPSALTIGSTAGATLEFNNISSTTTAPMAVGTILAGGTVTINVNSGSFTAGLSYPLMSWTGGSAPTFNLGTLNGAVGTLTVSGSTLYLNVTDIAYVWTGLNNGNWDTTTLNNWTFNSSATAWVDNKVALFDDTASGVTSVTLNSPVTPTSVTVNSATKAYSIASSGANVISGSGPLTKNGNSTLTLSGGVNTFGGATIISGGTLSVGALANGGAASDIGSSGNSAANLVLNGGTLQFTGAGATSDRLFTLGTGNGAIDASGTAALTLNNNGAISLSGTGARTLTLSGTSTADNLLAASLGDNGGATALTKSGAGKWIVSGNNASSGTVTIAAGTLQVGAGGSSGSLGGGSVVNSGSLIFNTSGNATNGAISGTGTVTVNGGGLVVFAGNNTCSGSTTISAGTLQIGTGGAAGSLSSEAPIVNNGTFILNSTSTLLLSGFVAGISGTGNVIVRSGSFLKAAANNTYTGWTLIEPNATLQPCDGNTGSLQTSGITNNGTLLLIRQDGNPPVFGITNNIVGTGMVIKDNNNFNPGEVAFIGTNTYTGGTFIAGGGIQIGDGLTAGAGSISGDVVFTNTTTSFKNYRVFIFNRPDDFEFTNRLVSVVTDSGVNESGAIDQRGAGLVTLLGNNSYPGSTIITAGTLQVGNGGIKGSIGTGAITDNGTLVFNRSDAVTVSSVISGTGSLVKAGAGTLLLNGVNTYTGTTTVSNGTFGGTGTLAGPVFLEPGTTLAPGASIGIGTMTFNSDLYIGGNVAVEVNKSLTQSNDLMVVAGGLVNTGTGTVTVKNLGPDLKVGDKFVLFSGPVSGGSAFTVTGAGSTWQNDLEVDGSIMALTVTPQVNTNPPVIQMSVSGSTLSLAWPTNKGWTLLTNSVAVNASSQWYTFPGSASLTNVNFTINSAKTNVFFRMVYTNTP
jgi:autotransporter-associated beta strand protein